MAHFIRILIVCFLFIACNNANKTNSSGPSAEAQEIGQEEESEWLSKLYAFYVEEPRIQQEVDENALIEYIVEKKIPVTRTRSGLYYSILEPGEGELINMTSTVEAHYKGYFLDEAVFDSSRKRGKPIKFKMGQMIPGWTEGLQFLKKRI